MSERKRIIDQSVLRDIVLFPPNAPTVVWEQTIAFTKASASAESLRYSKLACFPAHTESPAPPQVTGLH